MPKSGLCNRWRSVNSVHIKRTVCHYPPSPGRLWRVDYWRVARVGTGQVHLSRSLCPCRYWAECWTKREFDHVALCRHYYQVRFATPWFAADWWFARDNAIRLWITIIIIILSKTVNHLGPESWRLVDLDLCDATFVWECQRAANWWFVLVKSH